MLFVNTLGSFFVLLRLSTAVSDATGSGLLAGAVLSAPWLPALILAPFLNRILGERDPGRLVRIAEATSLVLTASLAALPVSGTALVVVAVSVVLVRGFFEAMTRSATSVLLRRLVDARRLNRANTFAEIGKLAGTSAGAAAAGPLSGALGPHAFFALNALTLAGSLLLAGTLPKAGPPGAGEEGAASGRPRRLRLEDPALRRLFALFLLVAFWQGFHTVAVNVVPRDVLGGGTSLVGVFVALSAVAIFAGSFAALSAQRRLTRMPAEVWAIAPMAPLAAAIAIARVGPTLAGYLIFLVLFEVAYVAYNNRLLAQARPEEVPVVVTLRATLLPAGVIVSILVVGLLADLAGPLVAVLAVIAVTVLVTAAPWLGRRPR
ncbi:MFS transporter [Actinoallomurus spadix]|uniref:MFS transporter n=1 Tax=Actinoallomurus spadix TaxID=79912 RepID=UPI00209242D3|nr:MFS transporter [Actinoallomurus spadix]MCO5984549.1 MFS transporter [Actinoallomurus spadix]